MEGCSVRQGERDLGVPTWSGQFWVDDEGIGYLSVAWGDTRTHRPPTGWQVVDSHDTDEAEVFICQEVT